MDNELEGGKSTCNFGRCLSRACLFYLQLRQAGERHSLALHTFALDCSSNVSRDTLLSSLSLTTSLAQCSDDKGSLGQSYQHDSHQTQPYLGAQPMLDIGPRLRHVRGHTNDYYHCTPQELWQEVERRGYRPLGSHDELSEGLTRDDHVRGTGATTVATEIKDRAKPRSKRQKAEYGDAIDPGQLVGESENKPHVAKSRRLSAYHQKLPIGR